MTEELKRKIIIRAIKNYKNRPNWEDSYVEETYADAIEYMLSNFDRYFGGSEAGSTVPQGARIKKLEQGDRSVEYEYSFTSTTTTSGLNALIEADVVLSVLLGLPLIRVM